MFPLSVLKISSLTSIGLPMGESSHILTAESITGFYRSTGTSGGQPKLIPSAAKSLDDFALLLTLIASVAKK
ncbi:hypothetical protein PTKIN_Ptkin11bG0140600 [Pterospermum kingtungense]